jgi:hypothetical protein
MSNGLVLALLLFAYATAAFTAWAVVRVGTRKRWPKPFEPLPPGYGERYHYREMFHDGDPAENMQPDILPPMPEDLWDEPTNTIEAFRRLTMCKVCGYRSRICSSEACPQRRFLP